MVHLDGFAIVSLKLVMNSSMRAMRFWREVKLARRRTKFLLQKTDPNPVGNNEKAWSLNQAFSRIPFYIPADL